MLPYDAIPGKRSGDCHRREIGRQCGARGVTHRAVRQWVAGVGHEHSTLSGCTTIVRKRRHAMRPLRAWSSVMPIFA